LLLEHGIMASCLGDQEVAGPCRWWHAELPYEECWSASGLDAEHRVLLEVNVCDITHPREDQELIPVASCSTEGLDGMMVILGTSVSCGGTDTHCVAHSYQVLPAKGGTWIYYKAEYFGTTTSVM